MTVFNAFISVIRRNLPTILLFTAITVGFAVINYASGDVTSSFSAEKPGVICIDLDHSEMSENLVSFLSDTATLSESAGAKRDEDALFYREVCCIITIPEGYSERLNISDDGGIEVKTTGDSKYSLVKMDLDRYLRAQSYYINQNLSGEKLMNAVNDSVADRIEVTVTAPADSAGLERAAVYFSFASYSVTSCILFIVCLVLTSFNERKIFRRTVVSSMNYNKYSIILISCCGIYVLAVWFVFTCLGFVLFSDVMFSAKGFLFASGSLIYSICMLSLSYLLSGVLHSKNSVNGIVNVISLGSAFLCGAFIPASYLPDAVLKIAHILPAYWYIQSNSLIAEASSLSFTDMKGVFLSFAVLLCFALVFMISGIALSSHNRRME